MKRHLFILPLLFLGCCAQAATISWSNTSQSVDKNTSFSLDIIGLDFINDVNGGGVNLSFDSSVINVVSVSIDEAVWNFGATGISTGTINNVAGSVDGIMVNTFSSIKGNFVVATVNFQVVGAGGSSTDLALSELDINPWASGGSTINPAFVNASVAITLTDSDGDGIDDSVDNCPAITNPPQTDTDNDNLGNICDPDDDNDSLSDIQEDTLGTNPLLADTDTDTVNDNIDNCPVIANTTQLDTDNDNIGDVCDSDDDNDSLSDGQEALLGTNPLLADTDNDGTNDNNDNCPVTANSNQTDTDNDGIGDACETDSDNDGLSDAQEAILGTNPLLADTDSDGSNDNTDNCPLTTNDTQTDTDNDSLGDACDNDDDNDGLTDLQEAALDTNPLLADTDGDNVNDNIDTFPLNAAETTDSDSDGVGDNSDNCPAISNSTQQDNDNDNIGDVCDIDDDNDGSNDNIDVFPLNAAESQDSDGDGVGNNADAFPDNVAASVDNDNNGKPDAWNTGCDINCQQNSGLTLDGTPPPDNGGKNTGGGSSGTVNPISLLLLTLLIVQRRRINNLFYSH